MHVPFLSPSMQILQSIVKWVENCQYFKCGQAFFRQCIIYLQDVGVRTALDSFKKALQKSIVDVSP